MSKDEPENLVGVDELYAHGASTPTKAQTRESIQDILPALRPQEPPKLSCKTSRA